MKKTAEKSEWIEIEALRAVYDSAPDPLKQSLGLKFGDIEGVICSASSGEPSILINRCFGLGKLQPGEIATIHSVKRFYQDAGVGEFFCILPPIVCQKISEVC